VAPFTLRNGIPEGTWHIVGDGIVFAPVDVTFELLWRSAAGDVPLVTFHHHFDPGANVNTAVPYEDTASGIAADAQPGDLLILRISASNTSGSMTYIPNGDGGRTRGRIPFVDLPN
jgi:hypothetical protein